MNMKKYLKKSKKNINFFLSLNEDGGVEKNLINICNGIAKNQKFLLLLPIKIKNIFIIKFILFHLIQIF